MTAEASGVVVQGPATPARAAECRRGHRFTPQNTILLSSHRPGQAPRRTCRQCQRRRQRLYRARQRARAAWYSALPAILALRARLLNDGEVVRFRASPDRGRVALGPGFAGRIVEVRLAARPRL